MAWALGGARLAGIAGFGVLVACVAVACAIGGDRDDGDLFPATGGTTNTATGGSGGATSTGGSGTAGQGGNGGDIGPCDESPCKVTLPQCGCPAGEQCTLVGDNRDCAADGTDDIGDSCSGLSCKAGGICLSLGTLTSCRKFCDSDADCVAPGGLCVIGITNHTEKTCSENCDPIASTGCPLPSSKCEVGQQGTDPNVITYTVCHPSGTNTQGQACTTNGFECAPGFTCATVNSVMACYQYCNYSSPACSVGSCLNFDPPLEVGTTEYGVCY